MLGCSDSRVPPEIIFDEGLGDLFVVRVAGNIVDSVVIGSLEYAVKHLGVGLILVLGHRVAALYRRYSQVASLTHTSSPSYAQYDLPLKPSPANPGDLAANAVASNVRHVVGKIKTSEPLLEPLLTANQLKLCGAVYHLDSGEVRLLE